ncbi:MAG: DNA polymerase III subunit chi [Roseateles sp.]|nr:DNA polymerase III subunit chi [Methylibium sp.]MBY0366012.1 DNA polymerase III subunit chi [Burkholderiaceae bacterium]
MGLQVSFYSDAADPLHFACRLVRRALASGKPLGVCVLAAQAAALDELLWSFEAQEFIPHRRWNPAATAEPGEVLLVSDAASLPHRALLLNLGEDMPSAALEFERILEVVGSDAGLVRAGRARYRLYQQAGARLDHFSAAG